MPKVTEKPKLTNRGAAGLLSKLPKGAKPVKEVAAEPDVDLAKAPKNRFAPMLKGMAVDIESLTPDPVNARLHPERNLEAIQKSLALYGQMKPVVVQKYSKEHKVKNRVVAGNGTMTAAIALGWTKIAANIMDIDDVKAAGYGIADNRTAELAAWDFEVLKRLDRTLADNNHPQTGWSIDELAVFRAADWTAPVDEGDDVYDASVNTFTLKLQNDLASLFRQCLDALQQKTENGEEIKPLDGLSVMLTEWLGAQ